MNLQDTQYLLTETYKRVATETGIDARSPRSFRKVLVNENAFRSYMKGLTYGLQESDMRSFMGIASVTRQQLLESNTMMQLNPYETLTLPILRNFYPKLIAKELVNVMPIDKPNVMKTFLRGKFRRMDNTGGEYGDYDYTFPSMTQDISRGPNRGYDIAADATSSPVNILSAMGLTGATRASHIEKDFRITAVYDATNGVTAVNVLPSVSGEFSVAVVHASTATDIISGHIDWKNGILYWKSHTGTTAKIKYVGYASLELNTINPQMQLETENIHFTVVDRKISVSWTTNLEQDAKALFDLNVQSESVNMIGEQIALDIDTEIINDLINANTNQNPSTHTDTFNTIPLGGWSNYAFGPKNWLEQAQVNLSRLSNQVLNTSFMGVANTIACNPIDAAIFESWNSFEYLGNGSTGGDLGYRSATVAGGKWKVLSSPVVPEGQMIVKYRSNEMQKASYVFAPYVPAVLTPFPLGANPSLTVQSRYATKVVRPGGIAVLNITDATA